MVVAECNAGNRKRCVAPGVGTAHHQGVHATPDLGADPAPADARADAVEGRCKAGAGETDGDSSCTSACECTAIVTPDVGHAAFLLLTLVVTGRRGRP